MTDHPPQVFRGVVRRFSNLFQGCQLVWCERQRGASRQPEQQENDRSAHREYE